MEPYTKSQLKGLKESYAVQLFKEQCTKTTEEIYKAVIEHAQRGQLEYTTSVIQFQLKDASLTIIMDSLKNLFPDANVMYIDRKMHGINADSMDLNKMGIISINWM